MPVADSAADTYIEETRNWLETVVIGLNLCPFAKRELASQSVRFAVTLATDEAAVLQSLESELQLLLADEAVETTLLILPHALKDFAAYNQFLDLADGLLKEMSLEGVFQVATFHPNYRFAGTQPDDIENYTNRSPYPVLHLLREASLTEAIDSYPDIDQVPLRNIETMKALSKMQIDQLFRR